MTRETRFNLIFIAVLLAVSLPGAVILARKKMEPGARQMGEPDPVRRSIPYMDPAPVPSIMARISPPKTAQWVKQIGRTIGGEPQPSQARQYEVLEITQDGGVLGAVLLSWQHETGATYQAAVGGRMTRVEIMREVQVPAEIQEELRRAGYIRPPAEVAVLRVSMEFDSTPTDGRTDVTVSKITGKGDQADIVTLFTRPDGSGK